MKKYDNAIGKIIKKRLIDLDINLKQLAEITGINYTYLTLITCGARHPRKDIPVLAKVLGLPEETLKNKTPRRPRKKKAI